jgi:hypothetical protein
MRHRTLIAATVAALIATTVTPAQANLWTGACALRITVNFRSPARPPLTSTGYDLDVAGLADLDLTRPGVQSCAATLSGEPTTETWVAGSGFASVWSCGASLGTGTWHQTFDPEGPGGFSGSHTFAGSWGAWTLQVANPTLNVVGAGEFTLQAVEATKTPGCAIGQIQSVTMVGTLVFQDP